MIGRKHAYGTLAALTAVSLVWGGITSVGTAQTAAASAARTARTVRAQQPAAAASYCPDVLFLGLRGDDDAPPRLAPAGSSTPLMDGSGIGADVAALDSEVESILTREGYFFNMREQGVPYDDADFPPYIAADYFDYTSDSANAGPGEGSFINDYVAGWRQNCPNTFLAVVGQSLGAMALHWAYNVPQNANAIVMFGDPLHVANARIDAAEDNSGDGLATGAVIPLGLYKVPNDWMPDGYPNDSLDLASNAESYCLNNDGVCGSGFFKWYEAWRGTHTQYRTGLDGIKDDAAGYLVSAITNWWISQPLPSGSPAPTPSPSVSQPPPPTRPAPPKSGLFVYNPASGANYIEFPDGNGGWTGGVKGPYFSPGWQVYTGQFTWNGRTDLFVYNPSTGANYTELSDGSGGWNGGGKGPAFSPGWQVYTGDFLGDGRTDLFLYNPSNGDNYVELPNNSGGWYGIKGPYFSPGWNVYPGDYNGDGKTDIWVYNPSTGVNYMEFADGSGGWTGGVKGPYFSPGWNVYPGDYNGDGKTDIWVYNPTTGVNYMEFSNGSGGWYGPGKGPYFSPGWNVYTADFNGDGRTDLFVYNPTTGDNYTELADGSGGWYGGGKGPYFSPGWNVYPGVYN